MDVSVLISWKTVHRPHAWTIGMCPYCSAVNAIRVDEIADQIAIYFVPVISTANGHVCKCDLCQRPIANQLPDKRLALAEWDHSLGLIHLSQKLGLPTPPQPADPESRIESLLSSVTESTKLDTLDISYGLTTGGILGVLIGAAIGYMVLPANLRQLDALGCLFAGILGGLLIGGIFGASVAAVLRKRSVPFQLISAALKNYSLNSDRTVQLAEKYPRRVRSGAIRARDAVSLAVHGRA